ncbi:hypothetical protein SDC9_106848 [bioreactor metagenome]|uniref:Uncharacterized protein n=1 Tax=bioreactor metagenome TaxID=1076179 RepID=A0A645B5W1_9ZZZZ
MKAAHPHNLMLYFNLLLVWKNPSTNKNANTGDTNLDNGWNHIGNTFGNANHK